MAGLRALKAVAVGEACTPADLAGADSAAVVEDLVAEDFGGNEVVARDVRNEEVAGMEEWVCCA